MSDRTKLDELISKLLPTKALPAHIRPAHLLDDSVEPPSRLAERVFALRQIVRSGGREEPLTGRIADSKAIAEYFRPRLSGRATESVWVAGLNAKNHVLLTHCVALGGATGAALEPRDVLRPLVLNNCTSFILVHNHPSGDPAPSPEDIGLTNRVREAGRIVGVRLLDHVIIGSDRHFSLLDAGLIAG